MHSTKDLKQNGKIEKYYKRIYVWHISILFYQRCLLRIVYILLLEYKILHNVAILISKLDEDKFNEIVLRIIMICIRR